MINSDDTLREILTSYRRLAVVGLSPKPHRPSYDVSRYMQAARYDITPVHPRCQDVLGETCVPDLAAAAEAGPVEIVNIFRRADQMPDIVAEAIAVGARVVWMQLGLAHEEAGQTARAAGLQVVMDRCIKVEHRRLGLGSVAVD